MRALAANLAIIEPRAPGVARAAAKHPHVEPRFDALARAAADRGRRRQAPSLSVSMVVHGLLIAAMLLVPLLWDHALPSLPDDALRAFFVVPEVAPPPAPPPPPPRASVRPPVARVSDARPQATQAFVAPIEVPEAIKPGADLGIESGVEGGVEGGVPGGVAGGVVGGLLPAAAPPSPVAPVVRVGGAIKAPKRLHVVPPEYPQLAAIAHVAGVVIVEARVDQQGRVVDTRVVYGHPLLNEAALAAVNQWRYKPLLLNGVPMDFVLTVTVQFTLTAGEAIQP